MIDSVTEWLEEINSAKKREKTFRKDGQDIIETYTAEKDTPFNILYSNTETLLPALFSAVPRPIVERRYKDEDPMGKAVAEAAQRMLEYLIDTDVDDYDKFADSMSDATLDGLLPGRGITAVKYESGDDWETACTESRKWDQVSFGYAHKWPKVPWVCYEEFLDKKEATRLFEDKVKHLTFVEGEEDDDDDYSREENEDKGYRKTTPIYQVWDKSDRTVKWISPQWKDDFLRIDEDPLGLTGFFNCPEPIQFVEKSNDLSPTPLYLLYKTQADELNRIQRRLNRVIEAVKVRGCYNGLLGEEIEKILKEDDNALVPTDKAAALMEGGFKDNIWFLPFTELVAVLQQLQQARESCKAVIYEVTGISDILRGQSRASETLGAQKIKEAWGTMRLKRHQEAVQIYSLNTMRLMLDIAVNKFNERSWARMTGLPYSSTQEKEEAEKLVEIARMNRIPPNEPSVQKAMQTLQKPNWGDILAILKDNYGRSYRIDIETNSTLSVEATEDKALVGDFMNAMAQFMNGMGPLIEKGIMPFPAAKSMMLSIVKRYRFGKEVEDELTKMEPPKPQQNPEQEKKIKEFQQAQQKFAQEQEKFKQEKQQAQEKVMQEGFKLKGEKTQLDFAKQMAKIEQKHSEELASMKQDTDQMEFEADLERRLAKQKADIQSMLDKQAAKIQKCNQKVA